MANPDKTLVRSLQRGLQIINVVAAEGPLHVKRIARAVRLPLPTAYHLLRTLVYDDYLVRLDDGSYVLGDRLRVQESAFGDPSRLACATGRD